MGNDLLWFHKEHKEDSDISTTRGGAVATLGLMDLPRDVEQ